MTKSKKLLALLLSVVTVFSVFGFSSSVALADENTAENNSVVVYSTYVNTTTSKITISGIVATCSASVTAQKSCSLKIKMEIQKKKSTGYETVKTWTSSKTGTSLSMSEKRNINVLSTYRLKTTFTAGSETKTMYKYA